MTYMAYLSPGHDTLDGQYLMTNGTTLGFLLSAEPPLQVYTTESSKDGLMEIHTYPIGIVNHALGLHGPKGLMNLVDMVNPQGEKDDDVVQVWDTFRMAEDGELLNDGGGQWYTFPVRRGGYIVKWYDGKLGSLLHTVKDIILMPICYRQPWHHGRLLTCEDLHEGGRQGPVQRHRELSSNQR